MTLTEAQLDKLCGGPPKHQLTCSRCGKTTRAYYSLPLARDAIAEHLRWAHGTRTSLDDITTD